MGESSKEELGRRYDDICKDYKRENSDDLKKELAILYGQEDIVVSNRGVYPIVVTLIVGLLALVVNMLVGAAAEIDVWLFRGTLVIFALLCICWLCKLFTYQHKDVAMRKQIIKMILEDRARKSHKQKHKITKPGDDGTTFTILVRR